MTADFYIRMLLAALVIVGIWTALGKDMILDRVGEWLETLPHWLGKPLGLCPPCMSSVYGTTVWFITGGHWTGVFIFILALCGLMKLIAHNLLRNG